VPSARSAQQSLVSISKELGRSALHPVERFTIVLVKLKEMNGYNECCCRSSFVSLSPASASTVPKLIIFSSRRKNKKPQNMARHLPICTIEI
jgi:hypothetical protein